MKRLSRSASSWMLRASASRVAASSGVRQAGRGPQDRRQRRAQIMRDRGQQRRPQPVGFHRQPCAVHSLHQIHPLDRQRRLVRQRVEQALLVGCQHRPGSSRSMPITPTAPRPVCIGRNSRFAPGSVSAPRPAGVVLLPAPARRGEVGVVQRVLRREAGAHHDAFLVRQQQHDAHLQHQRDLVDRGPQQIVEVRRHRQLAAEQIQLLGGARAGSRRDRLGAHPRGQIAGDHRRHGEEEQRDDVFRIGDGEGVERRQEKEIIGQRAERRRRTTPAKGRTARR